MNLVRSVEHITKLGLNLNKINLVSLLDIVAKRNKTMPQNKPIIKSIINDLDKRIKRISEKCVDLLKENKNLKSELTLKTQECERKDKEIYELHIIIDRLLEASGYDKNTSTAEDFEDVYENMQYKQGLLDQLKAENKQLKKQIESDKGLITNAGKQNYQLIQEYDRLKTKNEQIKHQIEVFTRQLENANKEVINEKEKNATERQKNEQAEQKLERIKELATALCYTVMSDGVAILQKDILQIIDEVE